MTKPFTLVHTWITSYWRVSTVIACAVGSQPRAFSRCTKRISPDLLRRPPIERRFGERDQDDKTLRVGLRIIDVLADNAGFGMLRLPVHGDFAEAQSGGDLRILFQQPPIISPGLRWRPISINELRCGRNPSPTSPQTEDGSARCAADSETHAEGSESLPPGSRSRGGSCIG